VRAKRERGEALNEIEQEFLDRVQGILDKEYENLSFAETEAKFINRTFDAFEAGAIDVDETRKSILEAMEFATTRLEKAWLIIRAREMLDKKQDEDK
jgi:translation elongation factor P/translation initiation factor 5A